MFSVLAEPQIIYRILCFRQLFEIFFLLFYWRDYSFPVFNVADSAITVGACLLLLDFLIAGKKAVPPTVPSEQIDVS